MQRPLFALLPALLLVGCASYPHADQENTRIAFANVTVNGQPAHFALDTGASSPVLLGSGAQRLHVPYTQPPSSNARANTWEKKTPVALSAPVELSVQGRAFTTALPVLPSLDLLQDGLIGWPEVSANILVFDAATRTVRAVDQLPPETASWLKFKIHQNSSLLKFEVPFPGDTVGYVAIDTGLPEGVALRTPLWSMWHLSHPGAPHFAVSGLLPGLPARHVYWADDLQLGPIALTDLPVTEYQTGPFTESTQDMAVLGLYVLSRIDLVVDYPHGFLYLQPRPPPGPPSPGFERPGVPPDPSGKKDWTVDPSVNVDPAAFLVAAASYKSGIHDPAGALADTNRALALNPQSFNALAYRAGLENDAGHSHEALADLDQAIALQPKKSDLYVDRGLMRQDNDDIPGALADFNRAIVLDSANPNPLLARGALQDQLGNYASALADFNRALELDPQDVPIYIMRAQCRERSGDVAGALADYSRALDLAPDNLDALLGHASLEIERDNPDAALADYDRALQRDPQNVYVYRELAYAKLAANDVPGALAAARHAHQLDPQSGNLLAVVAYCEVLSGQAAASDGDFTLAVQLAPTEPEVYHSRAVGRQIQGNLTGALVDYEKVGSLPGHADYDYLPLFLQVLRLRLGQPNPGFAAEVSSWSPSWRKSIGLFLAGQLGESALLAAAALPGRESPSGQLCEAWYYLGVVRLVHGDNPGARAAFVKSLATKKYGYDEYRFAQAALNCLDQPPAAP